jgi:hypothetical protein
MISDSGISKCSITRFSPTGTRYSCMPRRSIASFITAPMYSVGTMTERLTIGSSSSVDLEPSGRSPGRWISWSRRLVSGPCRRRWAPSGRGPCPLALEPLLHDLHVQQPEEAAAEAEAERLRGLRVEGEGRVVEGELLESFAQIVEVAWVGRVKTAEDHRLGDRGSPGEGRRVRPCRSGCCRRRRRRRGS